MTDWTDRERDALIDGHAVERDDLARLRPAVERIRAAGAGVADVEAAASILARVAAESVANQPSSVAVPARAASPWRRRALASVVTAVGVGVAVAGTAAAANGAAPGDALYGVDRAFEAIGIGDGGTNERLDEAVALAEKGKPQEALAHAAKAFGDGGDTTSADALTAAAGRVAGGGRSGDVAALLENIGNSDLTGKEFGQSVAEMARAIGGKPDDTGTTTGTTDPTPDPSPSVDDSPGKSGGKGHSDGAGKPDNGHGKPDKSHGKPDNVNTNSHKTR